MKSKGRYTIFSFLICFTIFGQSKETLKADELFNAYRFNLAIEEYSELTQNKAKDSSYVHMKLADCYYNLFNYEKAIVWYEKALQNATKPEVLFRYAEMLKAKGNYEEAKKQMQLFAEQKPNDPRAISFLSDITKIDQVIERSSLYDLLPLEMNTSMQEFGGVLYNNSFYFVSNRERKNAVKEKSDRDGRIFTNLYVGDFASNEVMNIREIRELNTRWSDETITFSNDQKTLFMASDNLSLVLSKNYDKKGNFDDKSGIFSIFKSSFERNKFWSNFEPLPFTLPEYSYNDPFLSDDGKTLYFASNMPGGQGGMDLWKVAVLADGTYGEPENLGAKINTILDERYPFENAAENYFYFSSNGHVGMGGLDVFKINLIDKKQEIKNLGKPVNSSSNDYAFIYYPKKRIGFVSSDRSGNNDIYKLREKDYVDIKINVKDHKTGEPIEGALVIVRNIQREEIGKIYTNSNGVATYKSPKNMELTFEVKANDYGSEILKINAGSEDENGQKINFAINSTQIETDYSSVETEILFDFNKSNINYEASLTLDKIVEILKANNNFKIKATTHSDSRGSEAYNQKLTEQRAMAVSEYLISKGINPEIITSIGMGSKEPKIDCKNNCTEEEHKQNRRSTFEFMKIQIVE